MVDTTIEKPFEIKIKTDSWFYYGWIDAVLGGKRRIFDCVDLPVRDIDQDAYNEGYDMAIESQTVIIYCMANMRRLNQITIEEATL